MEGKAERIGSESDKTKWYGLEGANIALQSLKSDAPLSWDLLLKMDSAHLPLYTQRIC